MQRKFNFTGRKRIARYKVPISCKTHESGVYTFRLTGLDFEGMQLPKDASVFIEAYYRTSYMRFDFGTVASITVPRSTLLEQIPEGVVPMFRVKIVKYGRILAAADRITPNLPDEQDKDKMSLLPVDFMDLGSVVWKLEIGDDAPLLWLNNRIEGIPQIARSEPVFLSLVYPEVVRRILETVLEEGRLTDDDSDWERRWVNFVKNLGMEEPPEGIGDVARIEKEGWIDEAVERFSQKIQARENFVREILGEGQ